MIEKVKNIPARPIIVSKHTIEYDQSEVDLNTKSFGIMYFPEPTTMLKLAHYDRQKSFTKRTEFTQQELIDSAEALKNTRYTAVSMLADPSGTRTLKDFSNGLADGLMFNASKYDALTLFVGSEDGDLDYFLYYRYRLILSVFLPNNLPTGTTPTSTSGGLSTFFQSFDLTSFVGGLSSGSTDFGGLFTGLLSSSPILSPYLFIGNLVGLDIGGFFNDTFGQVFTDGLSCWGSTFTPSQIENEIATIHLPYWKTKFDALQNSSNKDAFQINLNDAAKSMYICVSMYDYIQTSAGWESCSRNALRLLKDFYDTVFAEFQSIENQLIVQFNVKKTFQTVNPSKNIFQGFDFEWHENTSTKYPVYELTSKNLLQLAGMGTGAAVLFAAVLGTIAKNMYDNKQTKQPLFNDVLKFPIK